MPSNIRSNNSFNFIVSLLELPKKLNLCIFESSSLCLQFIKHLDFSQPNNTSFERLMKMGFLDNVHLTGCRDKKKQLKQRAQIQ